MSAFIIPPNAKINAGSGQRPFDQAHGWVNVDINPKWAPDLCASWNDLSVFPDSSVDVVVSHHSMEHAGCGEANGFINEAWRVLRKNGSLIVFVPDMRALAQRYLSRQISAQLYMTNVYGAFMSDEADRHKWGYDSETLSETLSIAEWSAVKHFDYRKIPGADIARDWWILGVEAVK